MTGTLSDEENPLFIFSLTRTLLLCDLLTKSHNVEQLIRLELSNRGYDESGGFIGFRASKDSSANTTAGRLK